MSELFSWWNPVANHQVGRNDSSKPVSFYAQLSLEKNEAQRQSAPFKEELVAPWLFQDWVQR